MTTLAAVPMCDDQLDLLELVADNASPVGSLHADDFRQACWNDALTHDGWVHPSRVSAILTRWFGEFNPRWFSSQWAPACGPNGFLDKTDMEAPIDASVSKGNGNKKVALRKWRATA